MASSIAVAALTGSGHRMTGLSHSGACQRRLSASIAPDSASIVAARTRGTTACLGIGKMARLGIGNRGLFLRSNAKRVRSSVCRQIKIKCSSADAANSGGSPSAGSDETPYQVLGVSPFEKFDLIKAAYTRRHRDAERRGDEAAMARFERAYDQLLMMQLSNRKKGRTFGDFEVPKEIRYADKQAWFPWGPRVATSTKNDILINLAVSAVIAIWMFVSKIADWKPLQFLVFGYAWRIFMKLADFDPPTSSFSEEDEDQTSKRRQKNGKRLLRTLSLVFGCVAIASLAFTGVLNGYELLGLYIPRALIDSQELFVTILSAGLLFITGSYLR